MIFLGVVRLKSQQTEISCKPSICVKGLTHIQRFVLRMLSTSINSPIIFVSILHSNK